MEALMADGILSGIRVLEWGHLVSGPWAARLLGDLGADVIKLEQPGIGDESRHLGPYPADEPDPEKSGLYLFLNANKRGVTLDVSTETGRGMFLDLIRKADVLVENHRPSEVEALSLTYASLREVNPRLVMVSISPFGQTGPYRDYVASELVLFNMGGVAYETPAGAVTDRETQPPLKGPGFQSYFVTGWLAATAALIALYQRQATGEGQSIDISEHEAISSMLRPNVARLSYGDEITVRQSTGVIRYKPCKDGFFIGLGIGQNDDAWRRLCMLLGNPEWTRWEKFATQELRRENQQEAEAFLGEWMMSYTKAELFEMTQELGIGAFPFNTVEDVRQSDQLAFRSFFKEIEHPVAGVYHYPGPAYLFSDQQPHIYRHAPLLGEHNESVFAENLGRTAEDLDRLAAAGVV
jgi:crotonobetainyl-CoA:carnitine CoA-transferase CaiB-like acyl-CoA transferase